MIQEVYIYQKNKNNRQTQQLLEDIKSALNITTVQSIQKVKIYKFEGIDAKQAEYIAARILVDPVYEEYALQFQEDQSKHNVEVGFKLGVMNPEVATLKKAVQDIGVTNVQYVDTTVAYSFYGSYSDTEFNTIIDNLLYNKTVERVITEKPVSLAIGSSSAMTQTFPLRSMSMTEMEMFSKKQSLYLNQEELETIQHYYVALGRDPYDAELEMIAQTWSEHCCHKTFKASLIVDGKVKEPLFTRLKKTAEQYADQVVSAFIDNAGVMRFYDGYAMCAKAETHNSPSAIEPYGGAATGSGGVFRDIMGTGLGAHIVASTDIFCFAPPDTPRTEIPVGCLHPRYLLQKVVAGVRDYGNRSGIPTSNGSVHFHKDFRAKPTVIVGAYGIMPEKYAHKGEPQPGDVIIIFGGRTGRDGIHGATFSSGVMDARTSDIHATAVQIGNPIEQKRMMDALKACRDQGLIRAITDCGAGGFSSAIGEMAQHTGARVYIERVPLKYVGLAPWEIWVSESQERMVCAVPPEHVDAVKQVCAKFTVEATDIGYFTQDNMLNVTFKDAPVCMLSLSFLHEKCPKRVLKATQRLRNWQTLYPEIDCWQETFKKVMSQYNVCSKEPIVRQYDHGVQAMHAVLPYSGVRQDGPNDATVLVPLYGKPYGMIISHGLHPILIKLHPYKGAMWAIAEALANYVAVGGNYKEATLIDNFIWPYPDAHALWDLDQAMDACVDAMNIFKIPFISGKDSLSSTYVYPDGTKLEIPPVLCVSVFGKIPDVNKTITADFKQINSVVVLLGVIDETSLGGSAYVQAMCNDYQGTVPEADLTNLPKRFAALHKAMQAGAILSCHDVSEGGVATTLAEMAFGGACGVNITLPEHAVADRFLFSETAGCFIIEIADQAVLQNYFADLPHAILGRTTAEQSITVHHRHKKLFDCDTHCLKDAWQQPLKKVFNS